MKVEKRAVGEVEPEYLKVDKVSFELAGKRITVYRDGVTIDPHPEYESDEVVIFGKAAWLELVRTVDKIWELLGSE